MKRQTAPGSKPKERVAVLGASPNPERYSNKAIRLLIQNGHDVVPVNPGHREIEGLAAVATLGEVAGPIDTVTVYLSPALGGPLAPALVALRPMRVIVNPGAESPALTAALTAAGIPVVEACTLVLLRTGQF